MKQVAFAGGCFWCVEHDLREVSGVVDVVSGYVGEAGGNPSYRNHKGYKEAVLVSFDDTKVNFKKLCQFFLDHIDPTDADGQFFDRGESYQTAIFYKTEEERFIAESLFKELEESGIYDKRVSVKILPEQTFYRAEEYHQRYAEKNPDHYYAYKDGSGRAEFQGRVCAIRDEKKIQWRD